MEISLHNVRKFAFTPFSGSRRPGFALIFLTRVWKTTDRENLSAGSGEWIHNWQTKMIAGEPFAERAIELLSNRIGFVGLTERFDESVIMLGRWLQEPGFRPEYRPKNSLADRRSRYEIEHLIRETHYMETEDVRAQIREAVVEDLKVYRFITENLFPKQLASYQVRLDSKIRSLQQNGQLAEPIWSRVVRNYVYKPLIYCRVV